MNHSQLEAKKLFVAPFLYFFGWGWAARWSMCYMMLRLTEPNLAGSGAGAELHKKVILCPYITKANHMFRKQGSVIQVLLVMWG